ncbi:MAG: hypothetical protein AcusKO_02670 [Acuticoccus sp.]
MPNARPKDSNSESNILTVGDVGRCFEDLSGKAVHRRAADVSDEGRFLALLPSPLGDRPNRS